MRKQVIGPLSEELEQYRKSTESSKTSFIRITPRPALGTELWQSKFLGHPYLPKGESYPRGEDGKPLAPLAQINFAEVPELIGYPREGIVQFYISDNDFLGLSFEAHYDPSNRSGYFDAYKTQKNFCVRYYPRIVCDKSMLTKDFDFLSELDFTILPVSEECRLEFELFEEYVSAADYNFKKFFGNTFDEFCSSFGESSSRIRDEYSRNFISAGSKIGGYADFVQQDPRLYAPENENWLLLLQIDYVDPGDGSEGVDIMWGDAGVGNFFIRDEALKALDFSEVVYYWDCA